VVRSPFDSSHGETPNGSLDVFGHGLLAKEVLGTLLGAEPIMFDERFVRF